MISRSHVTAYYGAHEYVHRLFDDLRIFLCVSLTAGYTDIGHHLQELTFERINHWIEANKVKYCPASIGPRPASVPYTGASSRFFNNREVHI